MNNMYDILNKMNLLESKGSKPDFLDLDKDGNRTEPMKSAAKSVDETSYSAKSARAGKDIGKPGKAFAKIAKDAAERYGSKERGEKVAGAVLAKLRAKEDVAQEGNKFTGNLAKARAAGLKKADLDGDGDMETVREYEFDDRDDFDRRAKPGDTVKTTKGTLKKTSSGVQHSRRHEDDDTGRDDDYDEHGNLKPGRKDPGAEKRGRGRPKGTKRAIGAKGPTGKSKLLKKGSIKEGDVDGISLVDKGEYDREGDMAREQLHTVMDAAKELHSILDADENLPEWVQSKITKALDYLDTARDYVKASDAEDAEQAVPERKLSKPEMAKREKFVKSMKKSKGDFEKRYGERGEEVMYATATKMAKKKGKEETEESTVAGSVATAPTSGKAKKGMVFGKGVYESQITESFNKKLSQVLTEGMSINMSVGENGEKNLSVTASDEDAVKLAQILKLAGMGSSDGYQETCPACGATPCGCEQVEEGQEDVANAPEAETQTSDYMTKTIAGGLNKNKVTGMTTIPVVPTQQVTEGEMEQRLINLYKQYKA